LGLEALQQRLSTTTLTLQRGRVTKVVGNVVEAQLPAATVGASATIGTVPAEVIGFRDQRSLLMPLDRLGGVSYGTTVTLRPEPLSVPVGPGLLGRVLDPLGRPMDGRPLTGCPERRPLTGNAPAPLQRTRITEMMETGISVIDGMLTLGLGQRIAIMAGSGVGKSTLLGMFARYSNADINIVALVGERGREVREFVERDLGKEGMSRSILIVSTSDSSPIMQIKCVESAMAVAEFFRDQGKQVLLMVDSLTRTAMAQRQIGLAAGEPPTTRGYTPSVFTLLPQLLERAGTGSVGGITAVCTVLVEGDDMNDPVADTVRGIVDGHIVLSRDLASHGHYPAVDVLASLSRTMPWTVPESQLRHAAFIRGSMATWKENHEIIRLGAYRRGADARVDQAIMLKPRIDGFLQQSIGERVPLEQTRQTMSTIVNPQVSRKRKGRA
jgi:FliI/YscN family ATPase